MERWKLGICWSRKKIFFEDGIFLFCISEYSYMYLPYENKTENRFSTNNTNKNSRMTNILIRKIGKEYFSTNYILHLHNVNTWKFSYPTFQTKTQNSTCKSFVVQNLICQSFSRALSLNSERTSVRGIIKSCIDVTWPIRFLSEARMRPKVSRLCQCLIDPPANVSSKPCNHTAEN